MSPTGAGRIEETEELLGTAAAQARSWWRLGGLMPGCFLPRASCVRLVVWPNTSLLKFAPVQPGDHAQVLALAPRLAEGVAVWRDPQAVLRAVSGWVESSLDSAGRPDHAVYVAIVDGGVAGVVTVCERAHFTGQVDGYVGELAVASGLERRGIATQLMDAAEAWAARRGLALLTLETGAANWPARAFYTRRSYQEEDMRLTKAIS